MRVRRVDLIITFCCLIVPLMTTGAHGEIPGVPVRAGIFEVRLEAEKQIYHLNEPVRVRVYLVNDSDETFTVSGIPPWYLTNLAVTDQQGDVLHPFGKTSAHNKPVGLRMEPHSAKALGWYDKDEKPLEWIDIANWGYAALPAGKYTIAAIPTVFAYEVRGDTILGRMVTPNDVRSNVLHIAVVP